MSPTNVPLSAAQKKTKLASKIAPKSSPRAMTQKSAVRAKAKAGRAQANAKDAALLALFGAGSVPGAFMQRHILLERVIADFRAGYPVVMFGNGATGKGQTSKGQTSKITGHILMAAETVQDNHLALFPTISPMPPRLVLTASRLRHLGFAAKEPAALALAKAHSTDIDALVTSRHLPISNGHDHGYDLHKTKLLPATQEDLLALELASLALLLPAVVVVPLAVTQSATTQSAKALGDFTKTHPHILSFQASDLAQYRQSQTDDVRLISRANVPLDQNIASEFVVFRGGEGLRDQVAIIVGKPDFSKPVPVRLHSACLTGDLFGSLKCDCGDQLRGTVAAMADNGGGILLYLDQEGRGTGIGNKMRAYALQAEGLDTYEADSVLGFEIDHRSYGFAATMLKLLGVSKISLLTNNPSKLAAMRAQGLEVLTHARVLGRQTRQNKSYLAAKRDKAGHFFAKDIG